MADETGGELGIVVAANHTLIKSLIALLAMKDEHLIDEMRLVFSTAHEVHGGTNLESEATLTLVRDALEEIASIVERDGDIVDGSAH